MAEKKYTENLRLTQQDETDFVDGPEISRSFQVLDKTIGNLENLTTEEKENLVAAVNEVKDSVNNLNTNLNSIPIIKSGALEITIPAKSDVKEHITFDNPFSSVPDIVVSLHAAATDRAICSTDAGIDGFNVRCQNLTTATSLTFFVRWIAVGI